MPPPASFRLSSVAKLGIGETSGGRGGQLRLLLHSCGPAAGFGHGSSNLLQIAHAKIFDAHLENAVVSWLGPQEEPAVVFGADLLVIV